MATCPIPSSALVSWYLDYRGGDEVNFGEIDGLPEIAAALQKERVNSTADLYSEKHFHALLRPEIQSLRL